MECDKLIIIGGKMELVDDLIDLRIYLAKACDGLVSSQNAKGAMLSTRLRILHLLEVRDASPSELISILCIAKGNLANLLKNMIELGVVESYKNIENSKNIYYRLTEKGRKEIKEYKTNLSSMINKEGLDNSELAKKIEDIIQILKGN